MRMLFVADLHYTLKQLDWLVANASHYDLVVIGGDLLDLGSALDFDIQIVVVEKYLRRIRRNAPLLVSSGNHDGDVHNAANELFAEWLLLSRADGLFVDGESALLGDTRVTACPWWNGPVSRAQLENLLVRESEKYAGRWIWSHHEPPEGARVSWTGKELRGDRFLLDWINRFEPDLVLSGHIHNAPFYPEGSWIDRIGKTWVFNPGRQPGSFPTYIILDFETLLAEWISAEGESIRRLSLPDL
jgi:Icc-related predicted phosphoesterase